MVIMEHAPYIPPMTEILTVHAGALLCVSTEPFFDNGDYNWGN